ncbi:MAG: Uma2 family endonuclease [Kiritimatiellia bacterium]|jgi:Uma2 family endonuclease
MVPIGSCAGIRPSPRISWSSAAKSLVVYLDFPPALIVEILSPSTASKDREIKFKLYEEQGVEHDILVDPTEQTIERFHLINSEYVKQASLVGIMINGQSLSIDPASSFA